MPKRVRELLGLPKKDEEEGEENIGILREASQEAHVATPPHHDDGAASTPDTAQSPRYVEPTAITNATLLQSKKSYWEEATKKLSCDNLNAYKALRPLTQHPLPNANVLRAQISEIIEKQKRTINDGQWTSPSKVEKYETKIQSQRDSIRKVIQIFKDVGSTVASLDPVHAKIPWAAINFTLQGALNDPARNEMVLAGVATIAPIVARYAEVEVIYQREPETTLKHDFEISLMDLSTSILVYQLTAARQCRRSTLSRFLRAPFKSDDWDAMLQTVRDKDAACKEFNQIYDSLD